MFPVVVRLSANRAVAAVSRRVCFNGGFAEESDLVAQLRGFLEAMIAMLLVNTGGSRDDLELYLNEGLAAVYIGQGDGRQHVEVVRYPKGRMVLRSGFLGRPFDLDVVDPTELYAYPAHFGLVG